jgi:hypothetical protein
MSTNLKTRNPLLPNARQIMVPKYTILSNGDDDASVEQHRHSEKIRREGMTEKGHRFSVKCL